MCVFSMLVHVASAAQTNKPNVVFILIDDMGYADTSCYRTSGSHELRFSAIDMTQMTQVPAPERFT